MEQEQTPQNIKDLVSEIGERMILFHLYSFICGNPHLEIFKNYSEPGYDIGIRNNLDSEKVKIEVKTRQHIITTTKEKSRNTCHFTVTENEWKCSDFLIGYWIDHNDFFIVPVGDLRPTNNGEKLVYKFVVSRLKNGNSQSSYSPDAMPFLNNWNQILEFAKIKSNLKTKTVHNANIPFVD